MRAAQWLLYLALLGLGLGLSVLVLGAYSNMTSDAPLWLRSIGSVEGILSSRFGNFGLPLFVRAVVLTLIASLLLGLAAYSKPR